MTTAQIGHKVSYRNGVAGYFDKRGVWRDVPSLKLSLQGWEETWAQANSLRASKAARVQMERIRALLRELGEE